ncbi:MAG TPA: DUF4810 domain-containing protein [Nitrosospira sp.]|nr:DUF4810 domain-containing protein [Nitrosospira sp.]
MGTRQLATMKQVFSRSFLGTIALTLVGCASPSIYHWGKFENGLHERYVSLDHGQADAYLLETIGAAEQQNLRVPPGAYADYGFLLFKRGDTKGAIAYFEKEKLLFPESSAFMTKLIERIKQKEAETAAKAEPQATAVSEAKP